jgi:hypothetical protein
MENGGGEMMSYDPIMNPYGGYNPPNCANCGKPKSSCKCKKRRRNK